MITTNDDEPLFLETEKCSSYRVRKDEKFNALSMSLILDESSKQKLQEFITETKFNQKVATEKNKILSTSNSHPTQPFATWMTTK